MKRKSEYIENIGTLLKIVKRRLKDSYLCVSRKRWRERETELVINDKILAGE